MWKTGAPARQKCAAKNAKCKECHRSLSQGMPIQEKRQDSQSFPGTRQPNLPVANMLKIVNHIGTTKGPQEKHLKFPIDVHPRGPYKHHLEAFS